MGPETRKMDARALPNCATSCYVLVAYVNAGTEPMQSTRRIRMTCLFQFLHVVLDVWILRESNIAWISTVFFRGGNF